MKEKIISILKKIFSSVIAVCMAAALLVFFAFIAAMVMGGEKAALICAALKAYVLPAMYYINAVLALIGVAAVYLTGEKVYTMGTGKPKGEKKN